MRLVFWLDNDRKFTIIPQQVSELQRLGSIEYYVLFSGYFLVIFVCCRELEMLLKRLY